MGISCGVQVLSTWVGIESVNKLLPLFFKAEYTIQAFSSLFVVFFKRQSAFSLCSPRSEYKKEKKKKHFIKIQKTVIKAATDNWFGEKIFFSGRCKISLRFLVEQDHWHCEKTLLHMHLKDNNTISFVILLHLHLVLNQKLKSNQILIKKTVII